MRYPLDRIYAFEKWYALNDQTKALGFGFGIKYTTEDRAGFPDLPVYHEGHDWPVPIGEPVYPCKSGTVLGVYDTEEGGKGIIIDHGDFIGYYWHESKIFCSKGQRVDETMIIGLSGNSGRSTGPHLHFEVRKNNIPYNPLTIFQMFKYIKDAKNNQHILIDDLKLDIAIGDETSLQEFIKNGLTGAPVVGEVPAGYMEIPGVPTVRLANAVTHIQDQFSDLLNL